MILEVNKFDYTRYGASEMTRYIKICSYRSFYAVYVQNNFEIDKNTAVNGLLSLEENSVQCCSERLFLTAQQTEPGEVFGEDCRFFRSGAVQRMEDAVVF